MALLDRIDIEAIAVNRLNDDDELNIHSFAESVIRAWIEKQEVFKVTGKLSDRCSFRSNAISKGDLIIAKPNLEK